MIKRIIISGKEFTIHSSALTSFKYKEFTGRELLSDLKSLEKLQNIKNDKVLNVTDDLIGKLLSITYVMVQEADKNQAANYEDFLRSLDTLFDDSDWMADVIETAINPISGGNKAIPPQK